MQGGHEFKTEIELLSRVHHKNLVGLLGFCFEQGEQMLVYEFMPNGTLRESLSGKISFNFYQWHASFDMSQEGNYSLYYVLTCREIWHLFGLEEEAPFCFGLSQRLSLPS